MSGASNLGAYALTFTPLIFLCSTENTLLTFQNLAISLFHQIEHFLNEQ